ncbi:MAG: hypothetical protein AAGA77_01825 [Bacteroidota bacterium]
MNKRIPNLFQSAKTTFYFLAIIFLNPFQLQSQNYLMDAGHSSYHAGAVIEYNTFENYYALLPGYTYKGRLTVGFDIGKNDDLVNGFNSTVLRPNAGFLVFKQGADNSPISVNINMAYQVNYLLDLDVSANTVQFGMGFYKEYVPLENVRVIPGIVIEGNKANNDINPNFEDSVFFSYGVQTTILWNNYYITPKVESFDGVITLGAKVGMIFSSFYPEDEVY